MFVADRVDAARIERTAAFVTALHAKMGMTQADEIPLRSKVLLSTAFVSRACSGEGVRRDGRWTIPAIHKTQQHLTSDQLLLRFFLGVMCAPGYFVCGRHKLYQHHRRCASNNLLRAVISCQQPSSPALPVDASGGEGESCTDAGAAPVTVTVPTLVQQFCTSPTGDTGDFFLGFIQQPHFLSYLTQLLEATLQRLCGAPSSDGRYILHRSLIEERDTARDSDK